MSTPQQRGSAYLPAGYYPSSSAVPAGGKGYSRNSSYNPSPPDSPGLQPLVNPGTRSSYVGGQHAGGRQSPGPNMGRQSPGPNMGRQSPGLVMGSQLYPQSSQSTLNLNAPIGTTNANERTPSAFLDDLFQSHGTLGGFSGEVAPTSKRGASRRASTDRGNSGRRRSGSRDRGY
ncbi:hypothetical protein LTS18_000921 [Coniosporium uncinatum]|uniref:Uncharacterized protein n=1 Tax=Coniosporium uncinatum TaxID=93489 RepID=A0ACC3CTJ6_9PEZI|nr:hypothetical protein LTS18_000921 [Coniosporium uncinatum]